MPLLKKNTTAYADIVRDVRPVSVRIKDYWSQPTNFATAMAFIAVMFVATKDNLAAWDLGLFLAYRLGKWFQHVPFELPLKIPKFAKGVKDPHNAPPGKSGTGPSEGILFLGNLDEPANPDHGKELWLTNTDARTHILYLGTTGSGKTEGLKAIVTNALAWASGFVYVDGKADTDLWASLFALARRFGRDDDLLILNYMTANSDNGAVSNTMNPFATGSASYLTNMIVNLMPDAGGDNAMWKERAVALMGALMPALTWKRDKTGLLLDVGIMRDYLELPAIIRLSRDPTLPERIIRALLGYLNTLPGYIDAAFDDEGNERPPAPDQPMYDLQVARQQHGYLSMQFTRSLQSLADDYGYIFKVQLADVDVLDIVINRRILIGLIPALEKSGDEAANLGKIVAASLKGMMGATLGNTVEGSWENAIGSKQTRSQSSFLTVFDEVGYYTAPGMAVMAAQARSLGFSLIFAAQDLPSMEKRVKQEAQSILANCNLKIFGKLEDPGDTKKFFQDHVGQSLVFETNGLSVGKDTVSSLFVNKPFYDNYGTGSMQARDRAHYDHLRGQREGEAHMLFAEYIVRARVFFAKADRVEALRVHKLLPVAASTTITAARERVISEVAARLKDPDWTAATAVKTHPADAEIVALADTMAAATMAGRDAIEASMTVVGGLAKLLKDRPKISQAATPSAMPKAAPAKAAAAPSSESKPMITGWGSSTLTESASAEQHEAKTAAEVEIPVIEQTAPHSYVPPDIDLNVVPSVQVVAESADVTKLQLPDDLASLIENAAQKLNKGLSEGEKSN